jgi:predicted Rossmann fold flavoprotein
MQKVLIVVGGGAAGIFCAVNAARKDRELRVIVLEKTAKLLGKVRVSGGGRCNVTHACFDIAGMAGNYPRGQHFVRKAFHQWFTTDTIEWFRERGVELKTEADGRMFPVTDSSQTIIDCLMKEINAYGVEIRMHADVKTVTAGDSGAESQGVEGRRFRVVLGDGRVVAADYLCVASGGYPKSGMFDWIRTLGHTVEEPVPSLFTFNMPGDTITGLMGVSVPEVQVKIVASRLMEKGPLLITHWGFSGPVILRLSARGARELAAGNYRFGIQINWIPAYTEQMARIVLQEQRQERAGQLVSAKNPFGLPQRLWEYFVEAAGIGSQPAGGGFAEGGSGHLAAVAVRWAELPARELNRLVGLLCAGNFAVTGKTTFKEEFVTAGGVKLSEVDPSTLESRRVPGLFFAGEILDVDGVTGGYNFQHAWTSGWIAADTIARRASQ